jgi:hypothetical protein
MRPINNKFDIVLASGKALAFFAVFMLVILGGTYAHADRSHHVHDILSKKVAKSLSPAHSHLGDDNMAVKDTADIHCGGEILFPPKVFENVCKLPDKEVVLNKAQWLPGLLKGLDPPPPRLFSKVI